MANSPRFDVSTDLNDYLSDNFINPKKRGSKRLLNSQTQFYVSGPRETNFGLILLPDVLGWKSGRIRPLCDYFGCAKQFLSVVPNLKSSNASGQARSLHESSSIMDWRKSQIIDGTVLPIIYDIVEYMKARGVHKIAIMGVAWGAWAAASVLASQLGHEFYCGALIQPSLDLEEQRYGGSSIELVSKLKRPIVLMPIMGDSRSYNHYTKLLKFKLPTCCVFDFQGMESGFLLHGFVFDTRVRKAIHKMVSELTAFFEMHFAMELTDFVVTDEEFDEGPEATMKARAAPYEGSIGQMKEHVLKVSNQLRSLSVTGPEEKEEEVSSSASSTPSSAERKGKPLKSKNKPKDEHSYTDNKEHVFTKSEVHYKEEAEAKLEV